MNTTVEFSVINQKCTGIGDQDVRTPSPFSESTSMKILYFVSGISTATIVANSAFYPSLMDMQKEFTITKREIDLIISGGLLINGLAPIIWGTMSDNYSRTWPLLLSLLSSLVGTIVFSLSQSKWHLLAAKVLQEMGSSGSFTVAFGVLADLFAITTRGRCTGIYLFGPSIGGSIGPLMAGVVVRYVGWRWAFVICAGIIVGFLTGLYWCPDTINKPTMNPPIQFSKRLERDGVTFKLFPAIEFNRPANPFLFLAILKKPIILLTCLSTCLTFIPLILIISIYPILITDRYHLNSVELGMCLIVSGVADSLGVIIGGKLADWFVKSETEKGGCPSVELRIKPVFIGAPLLIIGLSVQAFIMVTKGNILLLLCSTFVAFIGLNITLLSAISYMLDLFPASSSQVFGTNVLMRFGLSAVFTLFNSTLVDKLGLSHYYMLLVASNVCAFLVAVLIYHFGKIIREY